MTNTKAVAKIYSHMANYRKYPAISLQWAEWYLSTLLSDEWLEGRFTKKEVGE